MKHEEIIQAVTRAMFAIDPMNTGCVQNESREEYAREAEMFVNEFGEELNDFQEIISSKSPSMQFIMNSILEAIFEHWFEQIPEDQVIDRVRERIAFEVSLKNA